MPDHSENDSHQSQILAALSAMSAAQQAASSQLSAQLLALGVEMRTEIKALAKNDTDGTVAATELKGRVAAVETKATEAKAISEANATQISTWRGGLVVAGLVLVIVQAVVISWVNTRINERPALITRSGTP